MVLLVPNMSSRSISERRAHTVASGKHTIFMYVCMGVYSFRHSKLYLRDYCGHLYLLTYRSIPPGMTGNDEGRRYHSGLTCL